MEGIFLKNPFHRNTESKQTQNQVIGEQVYVTVVQQYNRCPNPTCQKLFTEFAKEVDYTRFPRAEFQVCPYCHIRIIAIQGEKITPIAPPITISPVPTIKWEKRVDGLFQCLECGSSFKEPRMFQFGGGDGHSVPKSFYCPNCNKMLRDFEK